MALVSDPTPLEYAPPGKRKFPLKQVLLISGAVLVLSLGTCAVLLNDAGKQINRSHTASNLRQIGQGIFMYASESGGALPPDLQTVLRTQQISPVVFVCGNSDETPAQGATPEEILRDFAKPGRCSFIYVGAGLRLSLSQNTVFAFDSPEHEGGEGVAVLYGDGHVDQVSFPMIVQILEDLSLGRNPPSPTTALTMDQAQRIFDSKWRKRLPAMQTTGWRPTTRPGANGDAARQAEP